MSGITNPAEEYFKDGLWGWVTNAWKKLIVTAGGALHIQFVGQEADVEVTQTAAADLTPGVCGWDGSAWQKLPLMFGYCDAYSEREYVADAAAGNVTHTFSTVPPDEIWIITAAAAVDVNNITTQILFCPNVAGAETWIKNALSQPAYSMVTWTGWLVLKPGDEFVTYYTGVIADDELRSYVVGFKMKITG